MARPDRPTASSAARNDEFEDSLSVRGPYVGPRQPIDKCYGQVLAKADQPRGISDSAPGTSKT